jgi:hypothetical protein
MVTVSCIHCYPIVQLCRIVVGLRKVLILDIFIPLCDQLNW